MEERKKHQRRPLPFQKKTQQEQPGALRLTGILGLAAALYLWWAVGGGGGGSGNGGGTGGAAQRPLPGESEGEEAPAAAAAAAAATARTKTPPASSSSPSSSHPAAAAAPATPATLAARAALRGASTVSLSAPGVLLRECEGGGLEAGATPRAGAVEALRLLASAASGGVYLICRVVGDVGEAAARGALEAAGAVGPPPAPVPPQRLLFCETAGGKIAAVRALEPGLHVDAEPGTLAGLARFVPRLALVSSQSASSCDGGGVVVVASPSPSSSNAPAAVGAGGGGAAGAAAAAAAVTAAPGDSSTSQQQQQLGDARWPSAPSLAALLGLAG